MAYSSRGGSYRGGGGASRRGGGGGGGGGSSNVTAYAAAVVVLVVVVVVAMLMTSKKKPPVDPGRTVAQPSTSTAPAAAATPRGEEKPYPPLPQAKVEEGRALARTFESDAKRADALLAEATRLKETDPAAWQSKLKEARGIYGGILDRWNAYVDTLPHNAHWDTDDVARHYLPRETGLVAKYTKGLASMKAEEK